MKLAKGTFASHLALHAAASISILLLPSILTAQKSAWSWSGADMAGVVGLALAYLLAAGILEFQGWKSERVSLWDGICAGAFGFGAYSIAMLGLRAQMDRSLLAVGLIIAGIYLAARILLPARGRSVTFGAGFAITVAIQAIAHYQPQLLAFLGSKGSSPQQETRIVDTAYHAMRLTFHDRLLERCNAAGKECEKPTAGGAIVNVAGAYLIASGDGHLYVVHPESSGARPAVQLLPYSVPLNSADFVRDFGPHSIERFRVTGMAGEVRDGSLQLYVAHHYWDSAGKCVVLRVSALQAEEGAFLSGKATPTWRTLFDTSPCLPQKGSTFYGDESGGRIARIDERSLLLSVGDLSMDGMTGGKPAAQDPSSSYGKTILIDRATGKGRIFSIGHRNPQGLFIDKAGTIWSTEHGPKGGDELNVIVDGQNYGWPYETYGTHALSHQWPLSITQGEHERYRMPLFSWLPDIAIGNLVRIEGKQFSRWHGDVLIGSYSKKLWRVRVRHGRVVYVEPIGVRDQNARIRDIVEDDQGRLVLLIDGGSIAVATVITEEKKVPDGVAGSDSMRGQLIFAQCASCHQVNDGKTHGIGPDLAGIVGREIASAPGFTYSTSLSAVQGKWSDENLDRFLAAPQGFAPGTAMGFPGIADAADRSKLIAYLKTLPATR